MSLDDNNLFTRKSNGRDIGTNLLATVANNLSLVENDVQWISGDEWWIYIGLLTTTIGDYTFIFLG
uniref:Ion_trans_2 domain-containing protein n=1 Tax=Heterorhabditis bacteriophora TaxID=37862 RepID=A0A1I7W9N1_HETBA